MMIKSVEHALGVLADGIWWFKGFAAARPPAIDEGCGEHQALENGLREIRLWLARVTEGKVRRLGDDATGSIVLTYPEFEAIYDFVGHLNSGEAEKERAVSTVRRVIEEYRHEEASATNPEVPF